MCFDRNYIAISILGQRLPLATLLRALEQGSDAEGAGRPGAGKAKGRRRMSVDPPLHSDLRAALLQLVLSLHVDLKPQEEFNLDNLTMGWDALDAALRQGESGNSSTTSSTRRGLSDAADDGKAISTELVMPGPTVEVEDTSLSPAQRRQRKAILKSSRRNFARLKVLHPPAPFALGALCTILCIACPRARCAF